MGLLAAISSVPSAQAAPIPFGLNFESHPQPQFSVTIGRPFGSEYYYENGRNNYHSRYEIERRRQYELTQEREARRRWEARHYRHQYNGYRQYSGPQIIFNNRDYDHDYDHDYDRGGRD